MPLTVASETEIKFTDGSDSWHRQVIHYVKTHDTVHLVDSLNLFLTDNGFLDSRVKFGREESRNALQVEFGERYEIGQLIFEEDLTDTLHFNRPLSSENMERAVDSVIQSYQAQGFYFASAVPIRYKKRGRSVDIYLRLLKGPPVTVSSVEIDGTRRTSPDFLRRYMLLEAGDTLHAEKIDESGRAFRKLDFVSLAGEPLVIPDAGYKTARVLYNFLEKKQFYFEGAGGYIPEDDGYFVWFIDLRGRNIFGSGQKAGFLVDKRETYKSVFNVYYGQPVFLLGPGDILLNLRTRDYRDQFYEFGVGLSYGINLKGDMTIRSELAWKNVEPAETLMRSFQVYEVGFGVSAGGIRVEKNAPFGYSLDWEIRYSGRRYRQKAGVPALSRSVFNDTRNELRAEISVPVFSPISDYHMIDLRDIESSEKPLPVSELLLFGGYSTLRGYRNDQFSSQRLVLMKSEMRFFLSNSDYVYPFADGAWFERFVADTGLIVVKKDDFKWGYGIGIRLSSETRYLAIELSWGEEAVFGEPRLNVTLANQF